MNISRRGLILGLGAALAAPAIVKVESLMAIPRKAFVRPEDFGAWDHGIISGDSVWFHGHSILPRGLMTVSYGVQGVDKSFFTIAESAHSRHGVVWPMSGYVVG